MVLSDIVHKLALEALQMASDWNGGHSEGKFRLQSLIE